MIVVLMCILLLIQIKLAVNNDLYINIETKPYEIHIKFKKNIQLPIHIRRSTVI